MIIDHEAMQAIQELMATATAASVLLPTGGATAPTATVEPIAPQVYYQKAGDPGNRALWVVFVIMLLSSLAFYVMAFRVPTSKRLFHVITALITTFATISYFAMAAGDGISYNVKTIVSEHKHGIPSFVDHYEAREVYWARYVDWSLTTPLLLMDLAFFAGLSGADLTVTIVADLIMVLTGLFAGLTKEESYSWGYYAMACIAYLVIVYEMAFNGRAAISGKDSKTSTFFTSIAGFTLVLWTAYPIIWGIADGARILSVDGEIISYAVLDVLAKPVFGFWLLFTHDAMTNAPSINGFWTHGLNPEGGIRVGEDEDGA